MNVSLVVRVRDEWELLEGLIANVMPVCSRVFVLDDSSARPAPGHIYRLPVPVEVHRSSCWSGDAGRLGEGLQRDKLIHLARKAQDCDWLLQLDANERLDDPACLFDILNGSTAHGIVLPLVDFYLTPFDSNPIDPGKLQARRYFGPEVRWTLALFRPLPWTFVDRGDVREPAGLDARRIEKVKRTHDRALREGRVRGRMGTQDRLLHGALPRLS